MAKKPLMTQELASRSEVAALYNIAKWLPNPDPVLKKLGKDVTVYRDLLVDARVWAAVQSRKGGVLSMERGLDRGPARSRVAKEVEAILADLPLHDIISTILDCVCFGFMPHEIVWQAGARFITPAKIEAKPPEWFLFAAEDNSLRLRTASSIFGGVPVPAMKFLVPRHHATYQNPYGEALLSRCFWPVSWKRGGWRWWVVMAEKYGMPYLIGKLPAGTPRDPNGVDDEWIRTVAALESMIQDAVAVIPDNGSIEIVEATGKAGSSDLYQSLVGEANREISTAILGHAGAGESTPGKLGNESAAMDVRADLIRSDANIVEQAVNQFIGWLVDLNWSGSAPPVWSLWQEEDVDIELAQRDEILSRTGVKFTRGYFLKAYNLEEEDIEEATDISAGKDDDAGEAVAAGKGTAAVQEGKEEDVKDAKAEFAENKEDIAAVVRFIHGQKAVDAMAADAGKLQSIAEGVLAPVIERLRRGTSFEEVSADLANAFPEMDTEQLQELIARAIFVADVWGRIVAQQEAK